MALAARLAATTLGMADDAHTETDTHADSAADEPHATAAEPAPTGGLVPSGQNVDWRSLEPKLQQYFCLQKPQPVWCTEWHRRLTVDPDFPILHPDEIPRPT